MFGARTTYLSLRKTVCLICVLLAAACAEPPDHADKIVDAEATEFLAELKRMDGQSGIFEGVYSEGHSEGRTFFLHRK